MGESEGFGSSGRADSEDSCFPKRKSISLNTDRCDNLDIPLQVISLSKMSSMERRDLELRLREELEQIQMLRKKILMRGVDAVAVSSSTNGQQVKKRPPSSQAASQVKSGVLNKPGAAKRAPAPAVASSNLNVMLMKQCEALLKRLMSHQFGWVFNTPVDVVKLNIPDYYSIIKHPMDLGTIKNKMASGAYTNPWGFLADVRLTFTNAMTYNPPGNDVHYMADTLNKFFEVRWKSIEKKLSAPDSVITREKDDVKPTPQSKKRKAAPANTPAVPPKSTDNNLKKMADEERHNLTRRLDALIAELPMNIIDFLKKHSNNGNQTSDDEIEIDMDALSDDTVFELKNLLDDYLREKKTIQQTKERPLEMEVLNNSGLSSSSLQPCKVNDPVEEDVDIGGNDAPIPNYPPVEIEKDAVARTNKCSSSSSSSSESGSPSSDSDSAASSGSESEVEKASSPTNTAKVKGLRAALVDQEKSDIMNPADGNCVPGRSDHQPEQNGHSKTTSFTDNGCQQGENASSEQQVSPERLYRAALLRSRFADTILKAREKALDKADKVDPEKLRREREELERLQREEKARLQAEARAAEEVRKLKQAEAAAEAKRKRELEREAARQALLQMEKTVEINENSQFLKDLEMLQREPVEQLPSSVDETSPDLSQDGLGSFRLRGSNPLEQLGLFMKADEEEEEDIEPNHLPRNDVEEGEID